MRVTEERNTVLGLRVLYSSIAWVCRSGPWQIAEVGQAMSRPTLAKTRIECDIDSVSNDPPIRPHA